MDDTSLKVQFNPDEAGVPFVHPLIWKSTQFMVLNIWHLHQLYFMMTAYLEPSYHIGIKSEYQMMVWFVESCAMNWVSNSATRNWRFYFHAMVLIMSDL